LFTAWLPTQTDLAPGYSLWSALGSERNRRIIHQNFFSLLLHHFFQLPDIIPSHGAGIKHPRRDPNGAITVMMACINWEEDAHELGMVA
jgi:hypothetical protein